MPIFEYTCNSCGKEFETLVRGFSSETECPGCHSTQLRKKLSAFAVMAGSTATQSVLPEACGSCGHPDGPGACQFN